MAEFKWIKGDKPKEPGDYIITIQDGDVFIVTTDSYRNEIWQIFETENIIAHSPVPRPFIPRKRRKNETNRKSNTRKTSK